MNVLMVTPVYDMGGTELYIEKISEGLIKSGHSVSVVSGGGIKAGVLDELGINHIVLTRLRSKKITHIISSIFHLVKIIKQYKPDLIHVSSVRTALIARLAVLLLLFTGIRPPVLLTLHGGPTGNIEKKSSMILRLMKIKVIAISKKSRDLLLKYGIRKKSLYLVHNGVDVLTLQRTHNNTPLNNMIHRLKSDGKVVIGFFGRLSMEKGITYLVDAMSDVVKEKNNAILIVAGDGPLMKNIKNTVILNNLSDNVYLIGYQKNPYPLIKDCDLIVIPSLWDMFPMILLESLALGKNIVAWDVGGISEALGDTGICIPALDTRLLGRTIIDFIESGSFRNKNLQGQKRVEEYFSLQSMINNTISVYESVLKTSKSQEKASGVAI